MSITPTPYESFSTSNQSILPEGAWSLSQSLCIVNSDASDYDIECDVSSPFNQTVYNPTLRANISINLANYGGTTTLDFAWTYWPTYFTRSFTPGSSTPVHSQVGDAGFDDSLTSVAFSAFIPHSNAWNNVPKISHSGSTSVVRGSDPTIGYIPLQINITVSTATIPATVFDDPLLDFWVKDIGFNITTPPAASSSSSSSPSPHIGVIVGATVGAVVFITLIVIALLLFRRRRERAKGLTFTQPVNHVDSLPHEEEGPTPVPWVGPDSVQPTPVGMMEPNNPLTTPWTEGILSSTSSRGSLNKSRPASGFVVATASGIESSGQKSSGSNDPPPEIPPNTGRPLSMRSPSFSALPDYPPPMYGLEESVRQDRAIPSSFSPALAQFASANRDVINESLEARLQAAGYVPTDDPGNLSPEQWQNEYGVTRLELRRLQDLYTQNK